MTSAIECIARPLLAALLAALASCGGGDRPSVLLITVDTLRADRLGCYGYGRDTTPNLDRLAEESARFTKAYSHAPFTAPSHASLFTSLHIASHGVYAWDEALDSEAAPMGERFRDAGYRTGAFYNHSGLKKTEITRGFEEVQLRYFEEADRTVDAFLAWLDGGEGPFAAWVHLWDVHRPYGFRDWRAKFLRDKVDRGSLTLAFAEDRFGEPWDVRVGRNESFYNLHPGKRAQPKRIGDETRLLVEGDYRHISDRYDGGVAYADRELGRLFEALRERGVLDDTLLVVTSDHGESLTERDACYFTHDPFLYEETLRVPLIVRFPGGRFAGRVSDELARGVDVLPTLLEVCDLPGNGREQGRSLVPVLAGRDAGAYPIYAQTQTRSAKERDERRREGPWLEEREAISDGRDKLIHDVELDRWSFYDLERDPGETHNLIDEPLLKRRIDRLRVALAEFHNLPRAGVTIIDRDAEDQQTMEHLGYVGGDDEDLEGPGEVGPPAVAEREREP